MRRVKVGHVLELQRRQVEVDPAREYFEIGVRSFGRGIFHKEPVRGIDLGNKRVFEIHPGDLVFSNVFSWEGAVALATDKDAGRIGSHRFMTYTPRSEDVDAGYLRYFFTSERGIEQLGHASPGSAGRNRTLAVDRFEAIEIPLPEIDEQRRIAGHLDRVHASVGRLNELSSTRGAVETLIDQRLVHLVNELRDRFPVVPLGDVARWGSGGTPQAKQAAYYDGDIPWAVIGDLTDGDVFSTERTITELGLAESSAKLVPPGSVLVAMYGSIGKLGIACREMATNQAIAHAMPTGVTGEYLFYFLRSIRAELVGLGQGGAQQNISQTILKSVQIPLPPLVDSRNEFVVHARNLLSLGDACKRAMEQSHALRTALIPAALNQAFAEVV